MSDWGKLLFYYDYKHENYPGKIRNSNGVISKDYKYPGVDGMIMHAYYGINYFLRRYENRYLDFDGRTVAFDESDYNALNTSFDVLFDFEDIKSGGNAVKDILRIYDNRDEDNFEENVERRLFSSEGMYGWLYLYVSDDMKSNKKFKYGYYFGKGDNFMLGDIRRAYDDARKRGLINYDIDDEPEMEELINKMIKFFEEEGELMTEDEAEEMRDNMCFWTMDNIGKLSEFMKNMDM